MATAFHPADGDLRFSTPYQDAVISPATIVIIPPNARAPRLSDEDEAQEPSKLNWITACIQAAEAGADEA